MSRVSAQGSVAGTKSSHVSKDPARISGMFDAIALRYDTLNHVLSAGLDVHWRRRLIRALELADGDRVLDVCTGTADLAMGAARWRRARVRQVVGVDFSGAMLQIGQGKIARGGLAPRVQLVRGDATRLPVATASCDAAMIAFGIRNVVDTAAALGELHRALRPHGRLAILEFGLPADRRLGALYRSYFRHILPRIGKLVSRHSDAYTYLPASVSEFPSGEAFADHLRAAGFSSVQHVSMAMGAVYLYLARRP
ncbi:MAG TPA: bifunctional demethylmenaquinone methyltransferase/2-methoxy-6-polyprenyl-1,4-benzoquinol methylase UbiE [Vicinamibacterales bacterium]|nr:bifunctional demethylmenaquinone methyltransferase/2-methoxy-6-polyprenyl-1,4-benzoquinol methylase UbiE [Vicinamibacterales bacterium]